MVYYTLFDINESKDYQHDIAYKLLEYALLDEYNIDLAAIGIEKGEHGKPYFPSRKDIHFNISHCKGMAACCLGKTEVGIDAERITEHREKVASRVFAANEINILEDTDNKDLYFYQIWTLKESFVKCIGKGISYPMNTVAFEFIGDYILCSETGYQFEQKIINDEYALSVCIVSDDKTDTTINFVPLQKIK